MREFIPFDYQNYMIDKIISSPKLGLFVPMGMGKSASTLMALDKLMYESYEINRVLIIAPLRVSKFTWREEIEKWTNFKNFTFAEAIGNEESRIKALNTMSDIITINRENVYRLVEYYLAKKKKPPFDMIIVDESSSFKNRKSKRWKALKVLASKVKRIILLSGTPSPNGIEDLWSQIYLLDEGERLGKTLTSFRNRYMVKASTMFSIFKARPGAEDEVYKKIKDITVSLKSEDHLKLPEKIVSDIEIKLSSSEMKKYKELENDYILELKDTEITALNSAVMVNKLIQLASGAIYTGNEKERINFHNKKIEALREILEENGESVMVFYNYEHEKERIFNELKEFNPRVLKTEEDKKDWDEGRIKLLVVHPASAGHGLNLQSGGRIIVWFSLTWNLEYYEQANARLYRLGQDKPVFIYHLIASDTVDEEVKKRLGKKHKTQEDLLNFIKAKLDSIKS